MFTAIEFEYLDSYFHFGKVEPDSLSEASTEPMQVSAKKAELHIPGLPSVGVTQECQDISAPRKQK